MGLARRDSHNGTRLISRPKAELVFLDSDFIVPNMRQITNRWYFISRLRFHCTKYEKNHLSLVICIIFGTMKIIGDSYHIWNNENVRLYSFVALNRTLTNPELQPLCLFARRHIKKSSSDLY